MATKIFTPAMLRGAGTRGVPEIPAGSSFTNTYSMAFDGVDDYILLGSVIPLGLSSISFWMKSSHSSGNGGITKGLGDLNIIGTSPLVRLGASNYRYFADQVANFDGEWHHWFLLIAGSGTSDITNSRLFVDGVEISSGTTISSGAPAAWTVSQIGTGFYVYLSCSIDEVAIWQSDQTSNISTIYNSGTPADLTSLSPVAWYQFNEGSGTTAIDSAGSNNGTISGATYTTDVPPS